MTRKPIITIDQLDVDRCEEYSHLVVDNYNNGHNSTRLSTHGIERDPVKQAKARAAEVAFCRWTGADVEALDWSKNPDPGYDVEVGALYYDVKSICWRYQYLLWPLEKRHLYATRPFNRLFLVKEDMPHFQMFGFVDKDVFAVRHLVAGVEHVLDTGTWYMHESQLEDPGIITGWRAHVQHRSLEQPGLWPR